mgnify:FL=1
MTVDSFLKSFDQIICPPTLLKLAKLSETKPRVAIADSANQVVMLSAKMGYEEGIMTPVFVGDEKKTFEIASEINWDISKFDSFNASNESEAANLASKICGDGNAEILMKGNVHSDVFIKAAIASKNNLRLKGRLVHMFYITPPGSNNGVMVSDAAVNVAPNEHTKRQMTKLVVEVLKKIGISNPKIAFLSASESVIESMPSTMIAKNLSDWASENIKGAEFEGPLALDLILSAEAARVKGILNSKVCGLADGIIVPDIVSGNTLFKSLVYLGAGCAAGLVLGAKVPLLLTSRADPPAARIASIALASISLNR